MSPKDGPRAADRYRLDEQIGFLLRQANQRHVGIFARRIPDLTPTQFAALAKLSELGAVSQNELGRQTAMDAATIKGVIDRLSKRGLTMTGPDSKDRRRRVVELTGDGVAAFAAAAPEAFEITAETLAPLTPTERDELLRLLRKAP